jgi:hypothetical protein
MANILWSGEEGITKLIYAVDEACVPAAHPFCSPAEVAAG